MSIPPQHAAHVLEEKDPTTKWCDDDEWFRSLTEAQEVTADIPEEKVSGLTNKRVDPKKVRTTRMGEFLRKYVSRRLLALSKGEIAVLMTATRQLGAGSPDCAEALAIFHQPICDEWASGSLNAPLARVKVDEKNCFGMIECKTVRKTAAHFFSKHTVTAELKHRNLSHVEQGGLSPMPKDQPSQGPPLTCLTAFHNINTCKHFPNLHPQRLELCLFSKRRWQADLVGGTWTGGRAQRQAATAASSGDAEAIELSSEVQAGIRIAELLEFGRIRTLEILGHAGSESLRLTVEHGSSMSLGHLKIKQIPMERMGTSDKPCGHLH